MAKVLLIVAAVCLGVAGVVQLLASPKVGEWVGYYRAYEPLPTAVVIDLATGYQTTARTYDELAASAEAEVFDTDAMRELASTERGRARGAQVELIVRLLGRGGQYAGLALLGLAGLVWWGRARRGKKHRAKMSAEVERDPDG